jgi:hypothetical protein
MTQGHSSSKTTGNDDVAGVDPGGTHPTKPGQRDKTDPKSSTDGRVDLEQKVESGDRNVHREPTDR